MARGPYHVAFAEGYSSIIQLLPCYIHVDVLLPVSELYMKATSDEFEDVIMPSFNVQEVNIQLLSPLV